MKPPRSTHDTEAGRSVAATAPRAPGRPALPVQRIVETALQIVDADGADALSMRTLAVRLQSGTATLYRNYASRAALVDQVVDRVLGEVRIDADALGRLPWQQACTAVAQALFDVLVAHKNVAPLIAERVPVGPNAVVLRERLLAVLLASGFSPRLAALAHATLARHVLGFALQLTANGSTEPLDRASMSASLRGLARGQFPATLAVARFVPVPLKEEFAFGMTLLVAGLEHVLATEQRPTPKR